MAEHGAGASLHLFVRLLRGILRDTKFDLLAETCQNRWVLINIAPVGESFADEFKMFFYLSSCKWWKRK
jgi:hypothetical protein